LYNSRTKISSDQIPEHFRANRPKWLQFIGRNIIYLLGWKVTGGVPKDTLGKNIVAKFAPHTSNWDGILGFAAIVGVDAKITFIGKHTVFRYGLGKLLKYLGGIPVDRSKPGDIIKKLVDSTKKNKLGSIIAIAPEGTRWKVNKFKTGFLRVAEATNAKILFASIDFKKKIIQLGPFFKSQGNQQRDLNSVMDYYKNFEPKHKRFF